MRKAFLITGIFIIVFLCTIGIKMACTSLSTHSFSIDSSITNRISFYQMASNISHGVGFAGCNLTPSEMDILRLWPDGFFTVYDIDIPNEDSCMVNLYVAVPQDVDFTVIEEFHSACAVSKPQWLTQQVLQSNYLCSYTIYSQYGYLEITAHGNSVTHCVATIEECLREIVSLSDASNTSW